MWRIWTRGWGPRDWWRWFKTYGFPMWVAWHLPRRIVMWCFYRVGGHATSGRWGCESPSTLRFFTAAERWELEPGPSLDAPRLRRWLVEQSFDRSIKHNGAVGRVPDVLELPQYDARGHLKATAESVVVLASINEWLINGDGLSVELVVEWRDRLAAALGAAPIS